MTVLNFNAEDKTHTLKAVFKTGNGRRKTEDFPISTRQATDPGARADAISGASNYGFGRGWTIVNWTIVEKAAA